MSFILEIRGPEVPPAGGSTPDETYGEGVWGPAIFGPANRSGLSDAAASTFESQEAAYALSVSLCYVFASTLAANLETRVREL